MKSKLFLFLFVGLILMTLVSAQTYQKDTTINLRVSCEKVNCSNAHNISVFAPNTIALDSDKEMTLSNGFLYYSFNKTKALGEYSFFVSDSEESNFQDTFKITPTGHETTTSHALIYGFLIFVSVVFLMVFLIGAIVIDGNNKFTMGGDLIEVNLNKYYKLGLFFGAYLFAIFTSYLIWQISENLLLLDLGTTIFYMTFRLLWIALVPIVFLLVIVGFMKWLLDVELHKLGERGLTRR